MRSLIRSLVLTLLVGITGCPPAPDSQAPGILPKLQPVNLNDVRPVPHDEPITLAAAKNEWLSFALQISDLQTGEGNWVRFRSPQLETGNASIPLEAFAAYQVLRMPVDLNRSGYVRHTGLTTDRRDLPRALIPCRMDTNGVLNLHSLRDPARGTDPQSHVVPGGEPPVLWVDLHVPVNIPTGDFACTVDLMRANEPKPVTQVPLKLTVYDFALPDERHLQMVGRLGWKRLEAVYPDRFETVTPRLLNRKDGKYGPTVRVLDQLMTLAQVHRAELIVPELQPTVKWPTGEPPYIDWADFDPLIAPWLRGTVFPDHVPLGYWPLPKDELVERADDQSQLQYWSAVATHFDQNDLLGITAVPLEKNAKGRVGSADSVELSATAAQILNVHPRIRVMVPLENDQIQLAGPGNPKLIDPASASRLLAASPSIISAPPGQEWPADVKQPEHWLRTDLPGLVPYVGAGGDERDVRVWAWLAFLRNAHFILWDSTLPNVSHAEDPADPNDLVWFYPGDWFGLDQPVPTLHLKWLRRAQQDYEYLQLASARGEMINTLQMARLITKPVQISRGEDPDPTNSLLSGTTNPDAWTEALKLLAQSILMRPPGKPADPVKQQEVYIQTLQWAQPQERPILVGRTAQWLWEGSDKRGPRSVLHLNLGIDIYNASETTPDKNQLQWTSLPSGWEIQPQPIEVPRLETYRIARAAMGGRFDIANISAAVRRPLQLSFTDGFSKVSNSLKLSAPVASSERREGQLRIDGALQDWDDVDAIANGPLVRMLSRPAVQRQEMQLASSKSRVYTGWARENFYVAFALEEISQEGKAAQNFVAYRDRRAWGEDLCEVLVQPIYADNAMGQVLHVVCKPNGAQWVERKLNPTLNADPWQPLEGTGVRYAATTPGNGQWRGELALPWSIIGNPKLGLPTMLRFNFAQHKTATGESASWAGPVDFGRDDAFTGILVIQTTSDPAFNGTVRSSNW